MKSTLLSTNIYFILFSFKINKIFFEKSFSFYFTKYDIFLEKLKKTYILITGVEFQLLATKLCYHYGGLLN